MVFRGFVSKQMCPNCAVTDRVFVNNEWLDGFWAVGSGICYPKSKPGQCLIRDGDRKWYPVVVETVGQDTGIVDSEGIFTVFEGDVVRVTIENTTICGSVRYISGSFCVVFLDARENSQVFALYSAVKKSARIEIVGVCFTDSSKPNA